jgi:hypothetical protein
MQAISEEGPNAPIEKITERANNIARLGDLLNEGLGGKGLQPNVPIGQQGNVITPQTPSDVAFAKRYPNEEAASGMTPDAERAWQEAAGFKAEPVVDIGAKVRQANPEPTRAEMKAGASGIREGHTPVDSSVVKSYKYDQAAREMEVMTGEGHGYVYGDVDPDRAQSFTKGEFKGMKESDKPSYGKAWNEFRKSPGMVQVAKIINGKRIATVPAISNEDAVPEDEWQAGHELETQVENTAK